uniref:intramembrane prenyl-peptidase Rce1 n=1 Tax=Leersia perrieri TaxID=77586 RepID=A0A0D9WFJ0_9ORYZ
MATPASFHHHPVSPPAIPGAAAVAACAAMAVTYVAVLYAPTALLRLPPPTSLRAFLHRRFACAAFSSAASLLAAASLLRVWSVGDLSDALAVFGIRSDHMLQAVGIPLLLTSLVYAGSLIARLWLVASSCGGTDDGESEIGWVQKLAHWIYAAVGNVMVWRNCVVAPITEELVFRACMVPPLLCGGFKIYNIIFFSPIFFSLVCNSLFVTSTLEPFVRTTPTGSQFYEITPDCRSGISSISGWFIVLFLAPFPRYEPKAIQH